MVRIALVCSALAAHGASAAAGLVEKTVTVGGYVCSGVQTAWVVRPDDDGQHPLVSFAHGYGSGGDDGVKRYYTDIIEAIASKGYVVVATESAKGMCKTEYKDQIHSLAWALQDSDLLPHIDAAAGTALAGQSMGGGSTVMAASQADAAAAYNIKAAAAIHPMSLSGIKPQVPILFLTGDQDTTISPKSVYQQYQKTSGVEKSFAEVKGAVHCDCCDDPYGSRIENAYVYDWLDCKMKGDTSACSRVTACNEPGIEVSGNGCHYDAGASALV